MYGEQETDRKYHCGLLAEELLTQPGFTFLLQVTKTNPYKMYETKLLRN